MKKISIISKVAAAAILGTVLLTGCGGGSSSSTADGIQATDGYIGGNGRVIFKDASNVETEESNVSTTGSGNMKFTGSSAGKKVTIKGNSGFFIDMNNDGKVNGKDKNLTFDMVTPSGATVVSHLTTLGESMPTGTPDQNTTKAAFLAKVVNQDTVALVEKALNNPGSANLLTIGEAAKSVLVTGGSTADLTLLGNEIDIDTIADNNTTDLNTTTLVSGLGVVYQNAAKAKADSMVAAVAWMIENKDELVDVDLGEMMANISDGGAASIADAYAATVDNNTTLEDLNTTSTNAFNTAITTAENAQPAVLGLSSYDITMGDKTVTLNGGSFDLSIDSNLTLADLGTITYGGIKLSKEANATASTEATFELEIMNGDKELRFVIAGAEINTESNSTAVSVTLPTTTSLTLSQTNIAGLDGIVGSSSTATLNAELTQSGLSFNVNTLLDAMTFDKKDALIIAIEDFLKMDAKYDVEMELNTTLPNTIGEISGTVTVGTVACSTEVVETPVETETPSTTTYDTTLTNTDEAAFGVSLFADVAASINFDKLDSLEGNGIETTVTIDDNISKTKINHLDTYNSKAFEITFDGVTYTGTFGTAELTEKQ